MHRFQKWRDTLLIAPTQQAVVGVMRDYIAVIPPQAIADLPGECRDAIANMDIQSAAVCLLRAEMAFTGDPDIAVLLHEIAHTYAAASVRMTSLQGVVAPIPTGE